MNAIYALGAFIAVIVIWNAVFKRNIGEAMAVGFLVTAAFAGSDALAVGWQSLVDGLKSEITFAALAFVFVSELLSRTGLVGRMVDILSSLLGRHRGGSAYAATVASGLFGAVAAPRQVRPRSTWPRESRRSTRSASSSRSCSTT